ncbi:MAG: GntR family transcriptional regulator [Oscillospiraceae bacterium]|nr:GntR family transcriptional regulator [Oscillospiraceae bacterium]
MNIVLNNGSETPLYKQIYEQLRSQIIKGELEGSYCLPPIRSVALELRVSVITVKKAWEELEREGLIYTVTGRGCFVAPHKEPELADRRFELAEAELRAALERAVSLGLSDSEIRALLEKLLG